MTDSSYNQFCPVAMAAEILGAQMDAGAPPRARRRIDPIQRFEARRAADVTRTLSKRLKDLEAAGIVTRSPVVGEPGAFEYRLTEAGRELKPVIEAIGCWGQRWIDIEASLEKLDPNLLMWDMRRNIDPNPMPHRRTNPGHLH